MDHKSRWLVLIGAGVVAGLLLLACAALVWGLVWPRGGSLPGRYRSNGEQIYFTATSQRGTPITSDLRMGMMGGRTLPCATCHGADGRGGRVRIMMQTFEAPDIRYRALTAEEHGEGEMGHTYTDEAIKRAITEGIEPDGEPLEWPMPRWQMSEGDLNDLLEFLKSLDGG